MTINDLGWANNERCTPIIDQACAACRALGHHPTDKDVGPWGRGLEHVVTCKGCGYVYRYDSSD